MYERKGGLAAVGPHRPALSWAQSLDEKAGSRVIALKGLQKPMIDGAKTEEDAESGRDRASGSVLHSQRPLGSMFHLAGILSRPSTASSGPSYFQMDSPFPKITKFLEVWWATLKRS